MAFDNVDQTMLYRDLALTMTALQFQYR